MMVNEMNCRRQTKWREKNDLLAEKQALEQSLQSEIDKIMAEAAKEKELAVENLEQQLTAEAEALEKREKRRGTCKWRRRSRSRLVNQRVVLISVLKI